MTIVALLLFLCVILVGVGIGRASKNITNGRGNG